MMIAAFVVISSVPHWTLSLYIISSKDSIMKFKVIYSQVGKIAPSFSSENLPLVTDNKKNQQLLVNS